MKLHVDRITESPRQHRVEITPSWWAEHASRAPSEPGDVEIDEPLLAELEVSKMGEDILIQGVLRGAASAACSRCAARYRHALREDLRLVLEPAGARTPAEPESAAALQRDGMCLGDELELGWYQGSEIELDAFLTEIVALALPMQPSPPVDERGRCAECGVDRSQPVESIEHEKPDSPFAVLATLRGQGDGGSN